MRKLNARVFGKNSPTDVIAFPMSTQLSDQNEYLGEIVVDQDEVARNAKKYKVGYAQELARVVAHGVLHLVGYEDRSEVGKRAMRAVEDSVVKEVEGGTGISNS